MTGTVVVFARAPGKGDAKTRLVASLGPELTSQVYRAMLTDTLNYARHAGGRVVLAHTPSPSFPEQTLADVVIEQRGATFGERFDHALADAYAAVGGPIVLIGADTPHLGTDALRRAFMELGRSETVLGPSPEGGFYLLGFQKEPIRVQEAFDAANEAAALASALRRRGRVALLEPTFDVDLPGDLVELMLQAQLHGSLGSDPSAKATLAVLANARVSVQVTPSGERARRLVVPGARPRP